MSLYTQTTKPLSYDLLIATSNKSRNLLMKASSVLVLDPAQPSFLGHLETGLGRFLTLPILGLDSNLQLLYWGTQYEYKTDKYTDGFSIQRLVRLPPINTDLRIYKQEFLVSMKEKHLQLDFMQGTK